MSSVGRLLSLFHANYKVKYNLYDDFIRCLDGALLSSEVNTLNSSCSDPCKNVNRGDSCFLLVVMKKNIRGNTVVYYSSS